MNPTKLMRSIYDWTMSLSTRPKAKYWLAGISFAESSFFPIPPDILLFPLCLVNRKKSLHLALICTLASVLGGVFGYGLGIFAFDSLAQPILEFYGAMDQYAKIETWYHEYGEALVLVAGLTPIPFKVFTISSGAFHFNLLTFTLMAAISRGFRFFMEAVIIYYFGEKAQKLIDKHFNWLCWVAALLLVGGFVVVKVLLKHG
ncbi:MAG: cytochrome B [Acidobacteria bacterium]|nr:MAG: cytochrome B [Acidobacteriota bacterium]